MFQGLGSCYLATSSIDNIFNKQFVRLISESMSFSFYELFCQESIKDDLPFSYEINLLKYLCPSSVMENLNVDPDMIALDRIYPHPTSHRIHPRIVNLNDLENKKKNRISFSLIL